MDGIQYKTTHTRPINASEVKTLPDKLHDEKPMALVIQGAVEKADDFTLETVKIYKNHFRNTCIILSTWEDEDRKYLEAFKNQGINIVLSKKPAYHGISNVNLQIESSKNGIARAKALGYKHVIKTRTDQRMYAPNIKEFLFNVTTAFPLRKEIAVQKERLIALSLNTFKYRLHGVSDMFLFGHIDDMQMYWSPDYDNRLFEEIDEKHRKSTQDFCECRLCEVYFTTEFYKKIGKAYEFNLKSSWNNLSDHFCIVDKESLDLFWPKYTNSEYRWLRYEKSDLEELTFREWLNLYAGMNNKIIDG